uniref:C2H2-type domain-containing protein n=1 Tax=Pelodiscus sinensis TaxID=13735 RepID=K7G9S4_PELSI
DADPLQVSYRDKATQVSSLLQELRQQLLSGPAHSHPLRGQALHVQLLPEGLPPALPPAAAHTGIHSKLHTAIVKPHKCPHCSKSFANTSYLAQHLRIHSGAKPYSCRYCQKAFRQLSHLQQHTRASTLGTDPTNVPTQGVKRLLPSSPTCRVPQAAAQQRQTFQVPQLPPCIHRCCLAGSSLGYAHSEACQGLYLLHLQPGLHLRETYLMKHMRKHNIPDPQQQVAQAQVQASQQQHFQPQGGGAAGGPSGDTNPPNPPSHCSFDLTPYKTSEHHKNICLTVSTSTIQGSAVCLLIPNGAGRTDLPLPGASRRREKANSSCLCLIVGDLPGSLLPRWAGLKW